MNLWLEALGFSAGAIVVLSIAQRVRHIVKKPEDATKEDTRRNAMQCAGNLLLMIYAALKGGIIFPIMCAASACLTLYLIYVKYRQNKSIRIYNCRT